MEQGFQNKWQSSSRFFPGLCQWSVAVAKELGWGRAIAGLERGKSGRQHRVKDYVYAADGKIDRETETVSFGGTWAKTRNRNGESNTHNHQCKQVLGGAAKNLLSNTHDVDLGPLFNHRASTFKWIGNVLLLFSDHKRSILDEINCCCWLIFFLLISRRSGDS